jgi:hypothetical protein
MMQNLQGVCRLFNLPIDDIKIHHIEQFLQSGVKEGTLLDFKEQFPNRLEKTISSMANTFGGMVLIGVEETTTGGGIVPIKGLPLGTGLRERVIQIGINAIYPPLIPEVGVVEFKSNPALSTPDKAVVVIRVHESDQGYAVDDRSTIYIRAENVSGWMRKATIDEAEWFSQKREKSVGLKNQSISKSQSHAQQFLSRLRHRHQRFTAEPFGRFGILTVPSFPRQAIATPKRLLEITPRLVRDVNLALGRFPHGFPRPVRDRISWADEESKYYYTEIHEIGLVYSEIEFWWDDSMKKAFLPHAAAKLLNAAVQFSRDLYAECGFLGSFDLSLRIAGVADRSLNSARGVLSTAPRVMDDVTEVSCRVTTPGNDEEMLSYCKNLIRQIYWAFGRDISENDLSADFK